MKTEQAIKHAGGVNALADLLGITPSAVSQWKEDVPDARQLQLERLTGGALKADPGCMERLLNPKPPIKAASEAA